MKQKTRKYTTKNTEETQELGKKSAKEFQGGETIGLEGNLGGGKTVFTKGVAWGLGIRKNITSPTFVFWRIYKVPKRKNIKYFCHVDLYRLQKPQDVLSLGINEYWQRNDSICLIEWSEKIRRYLPKGKTYFVKFKIIDPKTREITIMK